jgi:Mn-dependent DtxR family transcriptional regulator
MIKKLSEMDLIKYEKYGVIMLEPLGIKKGNELLQRHNLIENFLKLLNIEHGLLEETEKIEHTINEEILCGIKDLLNFFHDNPDLLDQFNTYRTITNNNVL